MESKGLKMFQLLVLNTNEVGEKFLMSDCFTTEIFCALHPCTHACTHAHIHIMSCTHTFSHTHTFSQKHMCAHTHTRTSEGTCWHKITVHIILFMTRPLTLEVVCLPERLSWMLCLQFLAPVRHHWQPPQPGNKGQTCHHFCGTNTLKLQLSLKAFRYNSIIHIASGFDGRVG